MRRIKKNALFIDDCSESESGFSLIEILLSLIMVVLLTDLMIKLCLVVLKQDTILREKISIEEKAKFVEFMLTREIQIAGFLGCNKFDSLNIKYHVKRDYFPIVPIKVFSKNNHPFGKYIHPESDILLLESMSIKTVDVLDFFKNTIHVTLNDRFELGEPLVFSDCKAADVLIPDGIQHGISFQILRINQNFNHNYKYTIAKFVANAFFIEKTKRKNMMGEPVYSLYSYDWVHHKKTECFSGVEAMSFFYSAFEENKSLVFFKPLLPNSSLFRLRLIKISLIFSQGDPLERSTKILRQQRDFVIAMRNFF